jgi:hypothetical protein
MRRRVIAVVGAAGLSLVYPGAVSAQVKVEHILNVEQIEIVGSNIEGWAERAKVKATVETAYLRGSERIAAYSIPVTRLAYVKVDGQDHLFAVCSGGQVVTLPQYHPERVYAGRTLDGNTSSYRLELGDDVLVLSATDDETILLPVAVNFMNWTISLVSIAALPPVAPAAVGHIQPETTLASSAGVAALALTVESAVRTRDGQPFAVLDDATRELASVTQPPDAGMEFALVEATLENRSDRVQVLARDELTAETSQGEPVFLWSGHEGGYAIHREIVANPGERRPLRLLALVKPDVDGLSLHLAGGEAIAVELAPAAGSEDEP